MLLMLPGTTGDRCADTSLGHDVQPRRASESCTLTTTYLIRSIESLAEVSGSRQDAQVSRTCRSSSYSNDVHSSTMCEILVGEAFSQLS